MFIDINYKSPIDYHVQKKLPKPGKGYLNTLKFVVKESSAYEKATEIVLNKYIKNDKLGENQKFIRQVLLEAKMESPYTEETRENIKVEGLPD